MNGNRIGPWRAGTARRVWSRSASRSMRSQDHPVIQGTRLDVGVSESFVSQTRWDVIGTVVPQVNGNVTAVQVQRLGLTMIYIVQGLSITGHRKRDDRNCAEKTKSS